MKTKTTSIIALLFFFVSGGYAQKSKIKVATKEYDNLAYAKTSEILLDLAKEDSLSVDLLQKLGNSFYFNRKMEEAANWYEKLMAMGKPVDPEYYFKYAQSLKAVENYEEAKVWMEKFHEADSTDLRGKIFVATPDYLKKIEKASKDIEIHNLPINSSYSDFGASQYRGGFVFASSRKSDGGPNYRWNEEPFLNLFLAERGKDSAYTRVRDFSNRINTKYHESTASFTPDGKVMYFTRNNFYKNVLRKDKQGTNHLKIFKAILQPDGDWGNIESVPFNSDAYSVAHPSVNSKGTKFYFASDMEGTIGQSDIFEVAIHSDGTLGTPLNLGVAVNTEGQETFPFINAEGDLYFSSDGFNGLGGLDVFVIRDFEKRREANKPLVVENVGRPINSSMDDFGYYENYTTKEGLFTSNRKGGKGGDDIYSFTPTESFSQVVEGVVKDRESLVLLPEAKITLFDEEGNQLKQLIVGEDADFTLRLEYRKNYLLKTEREGYISSNEYFTVFQRRKKLRVDILLSKSKEDFVKGYFREGADLAEELDASTIYFDFASAKILPAAEEQLQKIIELLEEYPDMKIDVRSHTDSKARYKTNQLLSERRNEATIRYLVEQGGINEDRITGRGYGERQLINGCKNGVPCTEEEHQQNRRTEFIVLEM